MSSHDHLSYAPASLGTWWVTFDPCLHPGQKRLVDTNCSPNAKKHKRTPKRTHTPSKTDKNGAGELGHLWPS